MRVILIAAAMTLVAGSAFAGADFTLKDKGTNAQGSWSGYFHPQALVTGPLWAETGP